LEFILNTNVCDGGSTSSLSTMSCTVPLSTLQLTPYDLEYSDGIYARIIATNFYGDSLQSNSGNGALMVLVPDAPTNLLKNTAGSSKSVISFTWDPPVFDGGETIIDYRVSYNQATGVYVNLLSGVMDASYTTSVTLTAGQTYSFYVEARNSVGYSVVSAPIAILAA
jgi:hypothetical protein